MEILHALQVQKVLNLLQDATDGAISANIFPVNGNRIDLTAAQYIYQRDNDPNSALINWIESLARQQAENGFVDANTLSRGQEILPEWVPFNPPKIDCSPFIEHWSNRTRQVQERHPNASKRGPGRHKGKLR